MSESDVVPEPPDIVVHLSPVWREKADFMIRAAIDDGTSPRRFEQLWARQIEATRFEICCVPFFSYDLALGDEVETHSDTYVIQRVVDRSGRYTFRAWFGDSDFSGARELAIRAITELACEFEWYSERLLAIDAVDEAQAQRVASVLQREEELGHLLFETGRTSSEA